MSNFKGEDICIRCLSHDIKRLDTSWITDTEIIVKSQCNNCGHEFDQHYHAIYRCTTDDFENETN